ncbi:MAG: sigma 54-interacting transcriptional regulator [Gemmatimonadales bacterium]
MSATPAGHLGMLRRITEQLASVREPDDVTAVLEALAHGLVDHGGLAAVQIWLYMPDSECPHCAHLASDHDEAVLHSLARAGKVHPDHMRTHHRLPLGWNGPGVAAETRTPFLVNDLQTVVAGYRSDPASSPLMALGKNWDADMDWCDWGGFEGGVVYPLLVRGDELVGAFAAISDRTITEEEFAHLGVFAHQAAISIRSAQLLHEANRLRARLADENAYLKEEIRLEGGFEGIVGSSEALRSTQRLIEQVARTESTVLLLGETGTGKELIARAIHTMSPRAPRPIIKVNCGAISPSLIESELFGHERGAFTGAARRRIGRFELADGGTLFLDEVGELPPDAQVKLLRVLQEQEFERVGGDRTIQVDVRLIAATNRDLEEEVRQGRFRADLYYRLNVFPVRVPPLRERAGDIPILARHFVEQFARKLSKPLKDLSAGSLERLRRYPWPGNVRELQNVLERACVLADSAIVEVGDLQLARALPIDDGNDGLVSMEEMERRHIRRALEASGGRIQGAGGAATLLGLHPNTLRSRMEKLGVARPRA